MKKIVKFALVTVFTFSLGVCAAAASPAIQDISAKFNPNIKYTLDGEEILEGQGAIVYQDRVYLPVRKISEAIGMDVDYENETVILKSAVETETKQQEVTFDGKKFDISFEIPKEVSPYVTTEYLEKDAMCILKFEKDGKSANIGFFSFFDEAEYDKMDPTQMPVPTEVLRVDGVVAAFQGLQDMPFEAPSEEADLITLYHDNLDILFDSFTMVAK